MKASLKVKDYSLISGLGIFPTACKQLTGEMLCKSLSISKDVPF